MEYTINGTDFQSYDSSVGTSIDELDALYYFQSYDSSVGTLNPVEQANKPDSRFSIL